MQFLVINRDKLLVDDVVAFRANVTVMFVKVSFATRFVVECIDFLVQKCVADLAFEASFVPFSIQGIYSHIFNGLAAGCTLWQKLVLVATGTVSIVFLFNVLDAALFSLVGIFEWFLAGKASKVVWMPGFVHGLEYLSNDQLITSYKC